MKVSASECVHFLTEVTLLVVIGLQTSVTRETLDVSIATTPPGAGVNNNEYRVASTLNFTCMVQGATGTVTYTWQTPQSTMPVMGADKRYRGILLSTDDGTHTCTATDRRGFRGSASVEVNVTGIGLFVITGDINGDGNSDRGAVSNNSLVISGTTGNRFQLRCYSESTQNDNSVGDFIGLDGSSINNIASDPFDVTRRNPAGIRIRNDVGMERSLRTNEQGVYTCRLPDSSGTNDLEVNIGLYRHGFSAHPRITSLTFDHDTRTLTCTSSGSPATTVTWRRNGVELSYGLSYQMTQRVASRRQSTYENILTINADISTVNSFSCTVANTLGSSSQDVLVFSASIAITPSGPATVGQSYSLTCTASSGVSLTVDYEWRDADNNLASSGQTLPFRLLHLFDAGNYTCQATITSPFSLTLAKTEDVVIQVPRPTVMVTHDNRNALHAGSRLTLTCDIHLNQLLQSVVDIITVNSEWSGPGISSGRDTVTNSTSSNLVFASTLTFDTLRTDDSGTYTCQATVSPNFNSQFIMEGDKSTNVTISVQNPSLTVSLLPNTTRLPNEAPYNSFSLTCTATAPEGVVAEKTFTWSQRFGVQNNGFTTLSDSGDTIQIETHGETQPVSTSVLTMTETTAGMFTYHCEVAFSDGGIASSGVIGVDITVTGPRKPYTLELEKLRTIDRTSSEVTVQWTVPIIAFTPETYLVHYGTNSSFLNARIGRVQSGDDFESENLTFAVRLMELEAGTEYLYQVNSGNSIGTTPSSTGSFTTKCGSSHATDSAAIIAGVLGALLLLTVVISIVAIALLALRNQHLSAELAMHENTNLRSNTKRSVKQNESEEPAYITTSPNEVYEMTQESDKFDSDVPRATVYETICQ